MSIFLLTKKVSPINTLINNLQYLTKNDIIPIVSLQLKGENYV